MISKQELDIVREAAVEGMQTSNDRILDATTRQQVAMRLLEWMVQFNSARILSVDGVKQITSYVFGDALFRDYILNLTASVLSRIPRDNQLLNRLNHHLASSYMLYVERPDTNGSTDSRCLVPKEITDRSACLNDGVDILQANQWLTVMILIREFYTLPATKSTKSPPIKP